MMKSFPKILSRFRRNSSGGVALMGGLTIGLVATSVIATVEITDMTVTKQKMQDRVDAAVLFATLQDKFNKPGAAADLQVAAREYILDTVGSTGARVENIKTNFVYDQARDRFVGEVFFESPAIFTGSLFTDKTIRVRAEAIPLQPSKMEVAIVLDVSGSMNYGLTNDDPASPGSRRIDALRDGVETLVTSLEDNSRLDAKISVIPYATSVDIAGMLTKVGNQKNKYFVNRDGGKLPAVGTFLQQQFSRNFNPSGADASDPSPIGAWGTERYVAKNENRFTISLDEPKAPKRVEVLTQPKRETNCSIGHIDTFGERCIEVVRIGDKIFPEKNFFTPKSGLLPMTGNVQDVRTFMSTVEAEGGTAGHLGAAWGLYALSPGWNPIFKHPAGEPSKFNGEAQKVLIIMTDGDFTSSHDPNVVVDADAGINETYDYFQSVCELARSKGVSIYTVGLRASALTDTQLTACAGSAQRYFRADNRAELVNAFEKIAENASRVRLSG